MYTRTIFKRIYPNTLLVLCMAQLLFSSFVIRGEWSGTDPDIVVPLNNAVEIHVEAIFDMDSTLLGYRSLLEPPVCEDSLCYAIKLNCYWDVLGRFERYEEVPGHELTKLDHEPFTFQDHQLLFALLRNEASVLSDLSKEELVKKKREDEVDGYSGATISAVKNEVVPGAVYSCYTLWHTVNGAVADSIQHFTQQHLSDKLLQQIVELEGPERDNFLLENFDVEGFHTYRAEVLDMLNRGGASFGSALIKKLPSDLISDKSFQDELAGLYSNLGYFTQKALVNNLNRNCSSDLLARKMVQGLDKNNSSKNEQIIDIICHNHEQLQLRTIQDFLKKIASKEVKISARSFKEIKRMGKVYPVLKEEIQTIKKQSS